MMREREEEEAMDMTNCLMLLSKVGQTDDEERLRTAGRRLFACKTCNRKFSSFQALGGHRASHKKPKLLLMGDDLLRLPYSPPTPKTHKCPICGLDFAIGQALGGHMRRHRGGNNGHSNVKSDGLVTRALLPVPVVKKSTSNRILCLDLNLMPVENDLTLQVGKDSMAMQIQTHHPVLNCYI